MNIVKTSVLAFGPTPLPAQHGVPFRLGAIETTATPWTVTHVFPQ